MDASGKKKILREINYKSIQLLYDFVSQLSGTIAEYFQSNEYRSLFPDSNAFMEHPIQKWFNFHKQMYDTFLCLYSLNAETLAIRNAIHDVTSTMQSITQNADLSMMSVAVNEMICGVAGCSSNSSNHEQVMAPRTLYQLVLHHTITYYNQQVLLVGIHEILLNDMHVDHNYVGCLDVNVLRKGLQNLYIVLNVIKDVGTSMVSADTTSPESLLTHASGAMEQSVYTNLQQAYGLNMFFSMLGNEEPQVLQKVCATASMLFPTIISIMGGGSGGGGNGQGGGGMLRSMLSNFGESSSSSGNGGGGNSNSFMD
jgi:hypothetical protein